MLGFIFKTGKWNREPAQQQLAAIILEGALTRIETGVMGTKIRDIFRLQNENRWSSKETSDRCVHAASMIKLTESPEVYASAKEEAKLLYNAFRS